MTQVFDNCRTECQRDSIDQTADELIALYSTALEHGGASWQASRSGLQIVIRELTDQAPRHPALKRLENFLKQQDRKSAH